MGLLTPDMMHKAASLVGESPTSTATAMNEAVPAMLAGLAGLASSDTGASQVMALVNRYAGAGNPAENLGALFGGGPATQSAMNTGREVLQTVFGGKTNTVADQLAGAAGVKTASASSLLSLAAPLVLGVLGQQRSSQALSTSGLASLLLGQRSGLAGLLPSGLSSLLGVSGTSSYATSIPSAPAAPTAGILRWLIPLALAAIAALWLVSRWGGQQIAEQTRELARVTLPGGASLDLREGSFNYNLARFLGDPNAVLPRTFVFEDLNFQTGGTSLTPESARTVTDLVAILKAYPSANVRLEGHTDNTGDAAANQRLSQDRADTVKGLLSAGGVDASRIGTAGFGQDHPIASNDTEEGRAKNRRIELVVTSK
jgi:outer membrane protein OmpA-like peptidoglycan-associated protein